MTVAARLVSETTNVPSTRGAGSREQDGNEGKGFGAMMREAHSSKDGRDASKTASKAAAVSDDGGDRPDPNTADGKAPSAVIADRSTQLAAKLAGKGDTVAAARHNTAAVQSEADAGETLTPLPGGQEVEEKKAELAAETLRLDAAGRPIRRSLFAPVTAENDPQLAGAAKAAAPHIKIEEPLSAENNAKELGLLLPGEVDPAAVPTRRHSGRIIVTVGRGQAIAEPVKDKDAAPPSRPVAPDAKLVAILGSFGVTYQIVPESTNDKVAEAVSQGKTTGEDSEARKAKPEGALAAALGTAGKGLTGASDSTKAADGASPSTAKQHDHRDAAIDPARLKTDNANAGSNASSASATGHAMSAASASAATAAAASTRISTPGLAAKVDLVSMRTDFEPATRRANRDAATTPATDQPRAEPKAPRDVMAAFGRTLAHSTSPVDTRPTMPQSVAGTDQAQASVDVSTSGGNGGERGSGSERRSHSGQSKASAALASRRDASRSVWSGSTADMPSASAVSNDGRPSGATPMPATRLPSKAMAAARSLVAEQSPHHQSVGARSKGIATDLRADLNPRPDQQAETIAAQQMSQSRAAQATTAAAAAAAAAPQASAGRQVVDAVAAALAEMGPGASSADPASRTRMRAGGAALKTIQIQLSPEQLGKVNVTLKLIEGNLAVHIETSEPETALRLKDDTEGLTTLLKSAGFNVDEASITLAATDGSVDQIRDGRGSNDTASTGTSRRRELQRAGGRGLPLEFADMASEADTEPFVYL
ncbi:flagellar hook-length control protein FliK [Jiella sp. MQZ9-1]|uniref:Flagellar hook-length control protein FliK n=1 Tax=Jiella flava TaxID=2816857 RepID=A0A939FTQ7_9HYPH|nr:flagellar hook-length control protein FliK [Jiella flava]MBO0661245.1 flagellar hook-length control protein FliK [Jiella flava]MCD2469890.1 flagellar hook-length control protein FliK [Jiella flava]